jgi:hypothetical protein
MKTSDEPGHFTGVELETRFKSEILSEYVGLAEHARMG